MLADVWNIAVTAAFFALAVQIKRSEGDCNINSASVTTFVPVAPQSYDRNYSDITLVQRRPLGYSVGRVLYNSPGTPNPCVRVCGTGSGRSLEIMYETSPPARLCFRDSAMTSSCADVGTSRACANYPAAADNCTYFEFYMDSKALSSEADVNFFYRFVVSADTDDNWCFNRDASEFPSSLLPPMNLSGNAYLPTKINHSVKSHLAVAAFIPMAIYGLWSIW